MVGDQIVFVFWVTAQGAQGLTLVPEVSVLPVFLVLWCFLIPVLPLVPVFPPSVFVFPWSPFVPSELCEALPGSTYQLQV